MQLQFRNLLVQIPGCAEISGGLNTTNTCYLFPASIATYEDKVSLINQVQ